MAGTLNNATLIGYLGQDPEVRSTAGGKKVASFSLATSDSWTDKRSGERRQRTEWHRIVVFDEQLVGLSERFLQKGSRVYLEGALQTRKWSDSNGQERFTTEIVLQQFKATILLLDNKPDQDDGYDGASTDLDDEHPT